MKISPRTATILNISLAATLSFALPNAVGQGTSSAAIHAQAKPPAEPELVLLDTDIGDDIDDAFALGLALQSPDLALLGITTTYGDTDLRAKLVDRYLDAVCEGGFAAGIGIPVIPGIPTPHTNAFSQAPYAAESTGPGTTRPCLLGRLVDPRGPHWAIQRKHHDAAGFLLDQIKANPGQITLIAIGPLFNIQAAIEKDPATFKKLKRVVIMGGSIDRGYDSATDNKRPPDAEWNIKCDPAGLRALLASGVPVYMMPLDSTQIRLSLQDQEKILAHGSPVTDQLALLYHQWVWGNGVKWTTPTLFDPVAVAYSIRPDLCPATPMRIEVDDKGFTRRVEGPPNAQVCLKSDETGFRQLLLDRLTTDPGR
jgi:inosine-uridine nucleoside N-ribohydrolase